MSSWREVKLAECANFQEGYVNPSQTVGSYFDGNIKWLRAVDLNDGFVWSTSRTLTEEGFRSAGKSAKLFAPDTLAISKSGTIGRVGILKDFMCGNRAVINVIPKKDMCHPLFLFFVLRHEREKIETLAEGSVQKNLYVPLLAQFRFSLPPMVEQQRIADTLGSLDDKIELNRRMNETLEAMAQAIFRDWFVDFGPTRRKIRGATDPVEIMGRLVADADRARGLAGLFPISIGDDGLPEGWEQSPFSRFVEIIGGGTPKTTIDAYWNGSIPWFSVVDTPPSGSVFVLETEKAITSEGLAESSARLIRPGTTIISARGTVGNLAVAAQEMTFNQSCYGLQGRDGVGDCYVFLASQQVVERLRGMAHGSVFSTITRQTFDGVSLPRASNGCLRAFEEVVAPLFESIKSNGRQSRTLAATRDLLLPKLMSGELRLRDAENEAKDAA